MKSLQLLSDSPMVFLSSITSSLFISPVIILINSCSKPAVLVLILFMSFFFSSDDLVFSLSSFSSVLRIFSFALDQISSNSFWVVEQQKRCSLVLFSTKYRRHL